MRRMGRSGAFTIVELMAVILIISFLAALLLPALNSAIESARRVTCLDDRRENYLQFSYYCDDHDGHFPRHNSNNNYSDACELNYTSNKISALGRLVFGGYIETADLVFCPTFVRGKPSNQPGPSKLDVSGWYYDDPVQLQAWNDGQDIPWMTDPNGCNNTVTLWDDMLRDGVGGARRHTYTGIAYYQGRAWWDDDGDGEKDEIRSHKLTFSLVEEHWDDDGDDLPYHYTPWGFSTSPLIFTCADYGGSPPKQISHSRQGLNGVFFDGSARWIDPQERGNRNFWNGRLWDVHCKFQKWSRKSMRLTPPR